MFSTKITVNQHERVLVYRDGRLERVLEPGRFSLASRSQVVRIDVRERIVTLAPQEVLTADGVSLRVTASLVRSVADPVAWSDPRLRTESCTSPRSSVCVRHWPASRSTQCSPVADAPWRRP